MRLGEDLGEEELHEILVLVEPVVLVPLLPAVVGLVGGDERLLGARARCGRRQRQGGRDEHHAGDPFRVTCADEQRSLGASRQRDEHRSLGSRCVHHRQRVSRELLLFVRVRRGRPIRFSVPAPVECHDAAMAREVGDLHLPDARVDDRPGREKEHRRVALAIPFPEDRDAVALHEAVLVRVAGTGLLGCPALSDRRHDSSFPPSR